MKRLNEINIQHIKILENLYLTKNTYTTAEELNISQSKVSRALAKLRSDLNDRLLIRVGNELHSTEYFNLIYPKLSELSEKFESVFKFEEFDPMTFSEKLVISINRAMLIRYGVRLYQELSRSLPNAQLVFEEWNDLTIGRIASGKVDLAMSYHSQTSGHIHQVSMAKDEFFVLSTPYFSLRSGQELTLDELLALPIISWNPSEGKEIENLKNIIKYKYGKELNISLTTDNLDIAVTACKESKGVFISAKNLIDESGLVRTALPKLFNNDSELNKSINLYCHYSKSKTEIFERFHSITNNILTNS